MATTYKAYEDVNHKAAVLYRDDVVVRNAAVQVLNNIAEKVNGVAYGALHPPYFDTEDGEYTEEMRAAALEDALTYAVSALRGIAQAFRLAEGGLVYEDDTTSLGFQGFLVGATIDHRTERDQTGTFSTHT